MPVKLGILGIGALGCYYAARLHEFAEVHLFGHWPEQRKTLREHGLEYVDQSGEVKKFPVRVSEIAEHLREFEYLLILVKSYQTSTAIEEARQLLDSSNPGAAVLTLQNGMGNLELMKSVFGERAYAGVSILGAKLEGVGRVVETGGGLLYLPQSLPHKFKELFVRAGFEIREEENMNNLLWSKLLINAAINPLTAIYRLPNGALLEDPSIRKTMAEIALEVKTLTDKMGISLLFDDPVKEVEQVARMTAGNRSSMLSDIDRGSRTEIDAISGVVVREGRKWGVPTPLNDWILGQSALWR